MVINVSKLPSRLMEVKKKIKKIPTLFFSEPLEETSNLVTSYLLSNVWNYDSRPHGRKESFFEVEFHNF